MVWKAAWASTLNTQGCSRLRYFGDFTKRFAHILQRGSPLGTIRPQREKEPARGRMAWQRATPKDDRRATVGRGWPGRTEGRVPEIKDIS